MNKELNIHDQRRLRARDALLECVRRSHGAHDPLPYYKVAVELLQHEIEILEKDAEFMARREADRARKEEKRLKYLAKVEKLQQEQEQEQKQKEE